MGRAEVVGGIVLRRCNEALLCLIVFLAVVAMLKPRVYGFENSEARQRIDDGKVALADAFKKVADAETAGANVSVLSGRLNDAADLLDLADVAFTNADFGGALSKANECVTLTNSVVSDAAEFKDQAMIAMNGQWVTVVFSVFGAAVFSVVLYVLWVWFRRFYNRKVLGLRPEVKS